ncbi:hypothetical protein OB919_16185 [Halobacteria archaeon AArc-curdl1]|uniref:Uncharacterized protein n=1 Tax=Natronosalvus hydrolyticus TaxID=2979988 RepID=A0AAP3E8R5_9EURY|nr:hypothetical protein [Halobacteria archaeon AArc-curdl1]
MSTELRDRVRDLLTKASAELESVTDGEEEIDTALEGSKLAEIGAEAAEILEETSPDDLVGGLGMAATDRSTTFPEAIATGDPEQVRDLRALVLLSRLSTGGDRETFAESTLERTVEDLRETLAHGDRVSMDASDSNVDADSADDNGDDQKNTTAEDSSGDAIRSVLEAAIDGFREEFEGVGDGLGDVVSESINGGDSEETESGADDETESDDETDDPSKETDEPRADEEPSEGADEAGLLGQSDSSSRRSHLSTVANSNRADMRAVKRHSTVPDR